MLTAKIRLRSKTAVCAAGLLAGYFAGYVSPTLAQSFDCSKASTQAETLICRNASLGDLDTELSQAFHNQLASDPGQRGKLLADERGWVAERDKQCLANGAKKTASDQVDCLAQAYRDRLAVLQARVGSAGGGAPNQALCQALSQKYRGFLSSAKTSDPSFDPQEVLRNLSEQTSSGVSVADWLVDNVDEDKMIAWAKTQTPHLSIPQEILDAIEGNGNTNMTLEHPPGSNLYVVNSTSGTLYCYDEGVYFRTDKGKAARVDGPEGWNNGESCMALRSAGAVDGTPALFEERKNTTRIGDYSVIVAPWREDHFEPGCTATFRFSQRFVPLDWRNPENEPDQCNGSDCDKLKTAAWQTVEAVQAHADSIEPWRKAQVASLTAAQAKQFKAMVAAASDDTDKETIATADEASTQSPLLLPLVEGGKLYLARVGHLQFHSVNMPGWKIVLQQLTDGELNDAASFVLDMQSEHLVAVTIK